MPRDTDGKEFFPGIYRGTIAAIDDPEERGRVRVRVHQVHDDNVPVEHLQWCEALTDEDRPLLVSQRVVVAFEGGDRNFPFVLGRWFSVPRGINDLKAERISEYNQTRERRMIYDSVENLIELNALNRYIRVKSGNAEVRLTKDDDGIRITSNGPTVVQGRRVNVESRDTLIQSGDIKLSATRREPEPDPSAAIPATGVPIGKHELFSNRTLSIYAGAIAGLDPASLISVGQIVDGSGVARQTSLLLAQPSVLRLGVHTAVAPLIATLVARIEAATSIDIESLGVLALKATTSAKMEAPLVEVGTIGGPHDFLVKYTALKAEFDAHTHPETGGTTGPPTAPLTAAPSTVSLKGS